MKNKTSILALTKAFFILLVMCCFSCKNEIKQRPKIKIICTVNAINTYNNKMWGYELIYDTLFLDSAYKYNLKDTIVIYK